MQINGDSYCNVYHYSCTTFLQLLEKQARNSMALILRMPFLKLGQKNLACGGRWKWKAFLKEKNVLVLLSQEVILSAWASAESQLSKPGRNTILIISLVFTVLYLGRRYWKNLLRINFICSERIFVHGNFNRIYNHWLSFGSFVLGEVQTEARTLKMANLCFLSLLSSAPTPSAEY